MADQGMPVTTPRIAPLTASPAAGPAVPQGGGLAYAIGQRLGNFATNLQSDRQAVYGATVKPVADNLADAGRGISTAFSNLGAGISGTPAMAAIPQQVATPAIDPAVAARVPTAATAAAVQGALPPALDAGGAAAVVSRMQAADKAASATAGMPLQGQAKADPNLALASRLGAASYAAQSGGSVGPKQANIAETASYAPAGAMAQILAQARPSQRAALLAQFQGMGDKAVSSNLKGQLTGTADDLYAAQTGPATTAAQKQEAALSRIKLLTGLVQPSGVIPTLAAGGYNAPGQQ